MCPVADRRLKLLTGISPFAPTYAGYPPHMAQIKLITAVVNHGERPKRPVVGSHVCARFVMTDQIWVVIEECLAANPASRPSAAGLLDRLV